MPALQMQSTSKSISTMSQSLEHLYRIRKEPYGVRAFRLFSKRAIAVSSGLQVVSRARNVGRARARVARLNVRILSLILQYQAISGGYGALRCAPKVYACCEPKNDTEGGTAAVACSWKCVEVGRECRSGFLGPSTP